MTVMSAIRLPTTTPDLLVRWEPSHRSRAAFYTGLDDAAQTVRVMGAGL